MIQELLRGAQRYAEDHPENQLGDYLERMMLFSENDDQDGSTSQALTLMTLHSAKGLEFPYVYMVGMSEGLFPNPRALDDDAEEEERRLCYVGITRAQRELVFSMAKTRKRYQETLLQEPSRFLMELDPKLFSTGYRRGFSGTERKNEKTIPLRFFPESQTVQQPAMMHTQLMKNGILWIILFVVFSLSLIHI